jgi:C-terminal processing protease CtpA/Prc
MRLAILIATIWCVVLVGCATSVITKGVDFNDTRVDDVIKGRTTKSEVFNLFGSPYQKTVTDSTEIWVYSYMKSSAAASSVLNVTTVKGDVLEKNLTLSFDSLGIVRSVSYISSGKGRGVIGITIDDDGYVRLVDPGKPAERAGLRKGDIVLKINNTEFPKGNLDYQKFLLAGSPGERIQIVVDRDGKEMYFVFFRD